MTKDMTRDLLSQETQDTLEKTRSFSTDVLAMIRTEQDHQEEAHGNPQCKTPLEWAAVISGWCGLLQVEIITGRKVTSVPSSAANSKRPAVLSDEQIRHRLVEIAATAMSALEQGWI